MGRARFESEADLRLELVNDDKVGEEGEDVFDLEEVRRGEEVHGASE
jgi:hypothetical protein